MTDSQPLITLAGGIAMPQLGLGVWKTPADETARIVGDALAAGYRAVDTASIYGNEEGVGEALEGRDDVFLTTKVWNSDQGHDATLAAFDASAARLRRDVVDLYLIHWPAPAKDQYVDTWRALIRLRNEGRVRAIGVSNFNPDHIARLERETGERPAINQIELHPGFQQRSLRAFHQGQGIATESWSPLGQGGALLDDPVIARIAQAHGRTPAQVVIRWHLDEGLVVIPKSANPARLRENIAVFDFTLTADERAAIAGLDRSDGRLGPDPVTADF